MRLGVPPTGTVEGFLDLEALAQIEAPKILAKFDSLQSTQDHVLSDDFVPNEVCQRYLTAMTPIYAHVFARDGQPLMESFVRRSIRLGLVMAQELLHRTNFTPSTEELRANSNESSQSFYEYIQWSAEEFLLKRDTPRVTLGMLLTDYSKNFTEDLDDHSRAVAIGGLTLLHIDENRYATFCENQISKFHAELEAFQGDLPGSR